MTWSLRLHNGDLVKGKGNSLAVIDGPHKVVQDLNAWFLEPYGTDPLNPEFGSFIDSEEGIVVSIDGRDRKLPDIYMELVIGEISRIIAAYMNRQYSRLRFESSVYQGSHTFKPNELIEDFGLDWQQVGDTLFVDVLLYLANGEDVQFEVPVVNNSEAIL